MIFDEINRKGFEGDLLLNGFAEFIRNLLICKDEKAARLLEVVEDFKKKYIETAKHADTAWLISALNVLGESEINFKAARNKRLHVELTLIKLAYLNQALHFSQGQADKKKGTESVKPVAFRRISPLEIKSKKTPPEAEVLLSMKTEPVAENRVHLPVPEARLIIDEPRVSAPSATLGALSKIRQEVVSRKTVAGAASWKKLETGALTEAWNQFTAELKKNKNSAAQSFEGAELRILDELRFEILTNNNLEQRFIEQEKRKLSDLLQISFRNKNISFSVMVREQMSKTHYGKKP